VPYEDGWTFTFGRGGRATQVVSTPSGYALSVDWMGGEFSDSEGQTVPHEGGPFVAELSPARSWLTVLPSGRETSSCEMALLPGGRLVVVAVVRQASSDPTWVGAQGVRLTVYEGETELWSAAWPITTSASTNPRVAALDDGTFVAWTADVAEPADEPSDPATAPEWTAHLRHYEVEGTLLSDSVLASHRFTRLAGTRDADVLLLSRREEEAATASICLARHRPDGEMLWESCFGNDYDEPRAVLALANGGAAVLLNNIAASDADEDFDAHEDRTLLLEPEGAGYFEDGSALVLVSASGALERASLLHSKYGMEASAVVEDSMGTLYVGGTTSGDGLLFGNRWLTYSDDLFVARFTSEGVAQGARIWGGIGLDVLHGLAVDEDDSLVAAGYFTDRVNFGQGGSTDIRSAEAEPDGSAFITKFRFYPEHVVEYPRVSCEPLPVEHIPADFEACHAADQRAQKGNPCSQMYFEGDAGYDECLEYGSLNPASDDTPSYCQVSYDAFSCP